MTTRVARQGLRTAVVTGAGMAASIAVGIYLTRTSAADGRINYDALRHLATLGPWLGGLGVGWGAISMVHALRLTPPMPACL